MASPESFQFDRIRGALAAPRPVDVSRFEAVRLAADPELAAAKAEWEQADYLQRRYKPRAMPGGRAQCQGCKKPLALGEDPCRQCGYSKGAGYLGVPAQTSYLERWR